MFRYVAIRDLGLRARNHVCFLTLLGGPVSRDYGGFLEKIELVTLDEVAAFELARRAIFPQKEWGPFRFWKALRPSGLPDAGAAHRLGRARGDGGRNSGTGESGPGDHRSWQFEPVPSAGNPAD